MSILEDIQPLIDQIKSTEDPDEKIFYAVSFLENENNIKELSDNDYILISQEIIKINQDAQFAAEIAKVITEKKSLHSFAQELIKDKSKYTGDEWSIEQFDKIRTEVVTMISENSDILFIESNTMLGDDNDWGAPEVEQWEGIYKGHDFLLDRIYENPQEPDADGHIYYDSFRWDWTELPSDEIVDSMGVISDKICDSDFTFTPWSLPDNNISESEGQEIDKDIFEFKNLDQINEDHIPNEAGIYAFRIKNINSLPEPFNEILSLKKNKYFYIGQASKSLLERMYKQELNGKKHGTFFRSTGAILGYLPPMGSLKNRDTRNYKFAKEDSIKIVKWMQENLEISYFTQNDNLDQIESELIIKYEPLLNIKGNPKAIPELSELRKKCVEYAKKDI